MDKMTAKLIFPHASTDGVFALIESSKIMVMEKLIKKLNANPTPKKKLPRSSTAAAYSTGTFGLPLKEIVDRDKTDIPLIVMDIFDYLFNNHGLEAEGIFRVNGNSRTVDTLRNLMDENGARWRVSDLSDMAAESERSVDVFSVASLLKLYLRELPGGLIPAKVTPLFLETYYLYRDNRAACFSQLEQLIANLPAPNYTLLQHLCHFLYKIWNCRAENKMSAEALGIVFGPNVFRLNQSAETIHDQGTVNRIMTFMVEHATQLFRMTAPSCANVTHLCSAAELLGPDQPVLVSTSPKTHGKSSDRRDTTAYPNSNSSSTDSLSQSTTVGFNTDFKSPAPLDTYGTCTTGENKLSSPKTGLLQTNEFSAGLAAAIRICIEEHAFRALIPQSELSKAFSYNDEGIDSLDVDDMDSETIARFSVESTFTTNRGQAEREQIQDPSFTVVRCSSWLTVSCFCDRRDTTAYPNSNSSSTDSLSQSTTVGFNTDFKSPAPLDTYGTCTTGENKLSSPKTGLLQTNEFSAGLAAAIRICIEEHAFRALIPQSELSKAFSYNDEGIDSLDVDDMDSETIARFSVESTFTTNRGQAEREQIQDPSFTVFHPASPGPNVTDKKFSSRISLEEANRKPNDDVLIQLTQRLHQIKTRLRDYERQFECASGHKPSATEKRADSQVRALMNELANIRTTIKQINSSSTTVSYEQGQSVSTHDRLDCDVRPGDELDTRELSMRPTPIASQITLGRTSDFLSPVAHRNRFNTPVPSKQIDPYTHSSLQGDTNTSFKASKTPHPTSDLESVRCSSGYGTATTIPPVRTLPMLANQNPEIQCFKPNGTASHKAEPSLVETYAVLVHRLAEKRSMAKRPEDLHLMTPKQIEAEKLAIQKALLYFEGLHGRPKGRQERLVMRPLYDRYRNVKRLLTAIQQNTKPPISESSSKSEFNKFDTIEDHPDISSDGDLAVRGDSDCQLYIPSGYSTVDSGGYNSTIAARIPRDTTRATKEGSDEEVELVVKLDPVDDDCQWSTHGSRFRRFKRNSSDRKHSKECLRDHSSFSSGDEESPMYIANNSADQLPPGSTNKSSTLPSSTTWANHCTGHMTEMNDGQSRIPSVNNEWFGSFRHGTNRGILKTDSRQSGSDTHFRPSAGTVSPEHQVSSDLTSPSHHLLSSGRGKSTHSPVHGTTGVYLTESRATEPRTDQIDGEKVASQKLSRNRRILSSPSEPVSTHTASDYDTQPTFSSSLAGWSVSQLQTELQSVRESKRQLQKTLKDYEHEFQNATGHKVERADRLCMRAEYNQYKALKTRLLQLETELTSRLC
ncbi:hypothetical protein AHF37_01663 [Paragonimus kellicotti]|nr:hypothetical protein AHF37_01663 [Paragonimus kellicotti]